ncbi:hypothetical protein HHL25_02025 [Rhizobium sp. S-51]|uniref:Membrane-associated oxidoreductase n=1 Tax=Rhizobium terricola TaxID=2728849 RepID=A0A7Y0ASV7_9HYPH|nr:hypothetical protein [Rhizobium terricola]NML72895.1 hypothetical protein [Rhizobium terricola]
MEYTEVEKQLFSGNAIVFDAMKQHQPISSSALRDAILAADLKTHDTRHRDSAYSLSHANITGKLDLADLYPTREDALISLVFIDCIFHDDISIARSAITNIRFKQCALKKIDGERVFVHGSVELDEVRSSEPVDRRSGQEAADNWFGSRGPQPPQGEPQSEAQHGHAVEVSRPQGLCHIHLRHSEIGRSVLIKQSLLVGPALRDDIDRNNEILNFALNLASAKIKGSVYLIDGAAALGGVSLSGADIQGDVYMAGARLVSGEGAAFNGQLLSVSGFVGLRGKTVQNGMVARFESLGMIVMMNARIASVIDLTAGLFEAAPNDTIAIYVSGCESIGSLITGALGAADQMVRTTVVGDMRMVGCGFQGDLQLSDLDISHKQSSPSKAMTAPEMQTQAAVLHLIALTVNGRLLISGGFRGGIDLSDTRIIRSVYLGNNAEPLEFVCTPENIRLIDMNGAQIESTLAVSNLKVEAVTGLDRLKNNLGSDHDLKMRSYPLAFAPGVLFHELQINGKKRRFSAGILETDGQLAILDGTGPSIISVLRKAQVNFDSEDNIKEYLRLFCHNICGDLGPFMIIERSGWLYSILPESAKQTVEDIEIVPSDAVGVTHPAEYVCAARVSIWYGPAIFRSTLALRKDLMVEMTDDESRYDGLSLQIAQLKPLKYLDTTGVACPGEWPLCPTLAATPTYGSLDKSRRRRLLAASRSLSEKYRTRPEINLQNAHVCELHDKDGKAWPDGVRLTLAGFTYDALRITDGGDDIREERGRAHRLPIMQDLWRKPARYAGRALLKLAVVLLAAYMAWELSSSPYALFALVAAAAIWLTLWIRKQAVNSKAEKYSRPWQARKRWLRLQYEDLRPSREEFTPQPFEQLAGVFRKQGQEEDFRRISRLKLAWKDKVETAFIWRPFTALYRLGFGYGFSTFRAFTTFGLLLLFGIWATEKALEEELLVLAASPDIYVAAVADAHPGEPADRSKLDVSCRGEINSPIYALDTLLPLIDLGQETRCGIRSEANFRFSAPALPVIQTQPLAILQDFAKETANWLGDLAFRPTVWQYGLAFYRLLGWIVLSLLIFTISNSMRRASGG